MYIAKIKTGLFNPYLIVIYKWYICLLIPSSISVSKCTILHALYKCQKTRAMFNAFRQLWGRHSPSHGRPVEHKVSCWLIHQPLLGEGGRKNTQKPKHMHLFFDKHCFNKGTPILFGGVKEVACFLVVFLKNDIFQIEVCRMGQICHKFLEFGCWTSQKTGEQIGRAVWAVVLATHQMHVC